MILNYQGAKNKSGIYKILNTHSNRIYIGQTNNFKNRWNGHRGSFKIGKHQNNFLKHDFNKCFKELGHDNFIEFHVLEIMEGSTKKDRNLREEFYISQYYDKQDKCYNFHQKVNDKERSCWSSTPEETGRKISETKKEFYKTEEGQELIQKLSDDKRGKTYEELYGAEMAAEIRKKISNNKLIEMNKPEVKENLRKLMTGKTDVERFGFDKAQKIKEKRSKARKGKYFGRESSGFKIIENINLLSPAGELFTRIEGIQEFATEHNLRPNHLSEVLAGKRKSCSGWRLINDILSINEKINK